MSSFFCLSYVKPIGVFTNKLSLFLSLSLSLIIMRGRARGAVLVSVCVPSRHHLVAVRCICGLGRLGAIAAGKIRQSQSVCWQ